MAARIINVVFLMVFGLISFSSCYYDKADLLTEINPCDTTLVSFTADISPIINTNCATCHGGSAPSAGIALTNYTEITTLASDKLLGVIRHEPTFSPMPKGMSRMEACMINKIEKWVNDGKPNN